MVGRLWTVGILVLAIGCGSSEDNSGSAGRGQAGTSGSGAAAGSGPAGGSAGAAGMGGSGGDAGSAGSAGTAGGAGMAGSAGSGPASCDPTNWEPNWEAVEDEVLTLINAKRAEGATCGTATYDAQASLIPNALLRASARCQSWDMAENDYVGHENSLGQPPWDRVAADGYTGKYVASTIAAGPGSAQALIDTIMSSEGDCKNLMNPADFEVGVGYYRSETAQFGSYFTLDYGGG